MLLKGQEFMKKNILNELESELFFFDGTVCFEGRGSQLVNCLKTGILRALTQHCDLNAGADIILANTFGANELKFPDNLEEIVTKGVQNAKYSRGNR